MRSGVEEAGPLKEGSTVLYGFAARRRREDWNRHWELARLWKLLRIAGRGEEAEKVSGERADGSTAKASDPEEGDAESCDGAGWEEAGLSREEGREEEGRREEEGEEERGG
mmetsp:Transcript_33161/g.104864  ORF Transcript_33161/g.104864 Transcript_33161/m.104864 type:complete len:111 (+) Transcript_33161:2719-3051(+)